jgi:chitin disaccharide deacetylase
LTTRLIINADDYGRTPDISRGIRYAHKNGLVTSTTCMMNMPTIVDEIKNALKETPTLGLGVHLVLTYGKPLLPVSKILGLTDSEGSFLKPEAFSKKVSNLDPDIVKGEWRAQIEAFITAAGKNPTHLDSHHHSSYFTPALVKAMFETAREYNLPIRLPLPHGQNQLFTGFPEELVDDLAEFAPKILEEFQPRSPDAFFASFYDSQATRAEFLRILGHFLPNGTFELMCHPGFVNESFAAESSYSFQRQTELEILTDPAMRKEVDKRGIELISFAQL